MAGLGNKAIPTLRNVDQLTCVVEAAMKVFREDDDT